jgi:hypothetical protein
VRRREFITLLGGAAAAWPLAAHALASKNIPRLCFLTFDPVTSRSTRFDAFFQGLVDLGYVDGKTGQDPQFAEKRRATFTTPTNKSWCACNSGSIARVSAADKILDPALGKAPKRIDIVALRHSEIVYLSAQEIREALAACGVPPVSLDHARRSIIDSASESNEEHKCRWYGRGRWF